MSLEFRRVVRAMREQHKGKTDTHRLDWLLHRISGKALRDIGVVYSSGSDKHSLREAIDRAMGKA